MFFQKNALLSLLSVVLWYDVFNVYGKGGIKKLVHLSHLKGYFCAHWFKCDKSINLETGTFVWILLLLFKKDK